MNKELTQKQKDLFKIICSYIDDNKISPTNRGLMLQLGLKSTSTIHGHLERLREKGYITWQDSMPRTIQVLKRREA